MGRIVTTLKRVGVLDNTVIIVASDNGASGEGGLAGTFNETYAINGLQTPLETNMKHFDAWGGPSTYPHYTAGWAMAGNTPFKYFKQAVHRGGIQDAADCVVAEGDPCTRRDPRPVPPHRRHRADPLDIIGVDVPDEIDGIKHQPMDGISMRYALNDAKAPDAKKVQYYEMFGNRAIWADGWKAVTLHANRLPTSTSWHRSNRTDGNCTRCPKTSARAPMSRRSIPPSSRNFRNSSTNMRASTMCIRCATT